MLRYNRPGIAGSTHGVFPLMHFECRACIHLQLCLHHVRLLSGRADRPPFRPSTCISLYIIWRSSRRHSLLLAAYSVLYLNMYRFLSVGCCRMRNYMIPCDLFTSCLVSSAWAMGGHPRYPCTSRGSGATHFLRAMRACSRMLMLMRMLIPRSLLT